MLGDDLNDGSIDSAWCWITSSWIGKRNLRSVPDSVTSKPISSLDFLLPVCKMRVLIRFANSWVLLGLQTVEAHE